MTNLFNFYNKVTGFVNEGGALGVIYLILGWFLTLCPIVILKPKQIYYSMEEWITRLVKNCLGEQAQTDMVNGLHSVRRPDRSTRLHWGPVLLNITINGHTGHSPRLQMIPK